MSNISPKKIIFVTGTRADFGKQLPLAEVAVNEGHHVTFFITGMHMLKAFGETRFEVRKHTHFEFFECINHRHGDRQDEILAKTLLAFSDWLAEHKPDLVLVHGDRVESVACAMACSTNYIPCAHIEGGEVSGTIDEVYRHCITKLANIHLASSQDSGRRIRKIGENPETIHVVGSPELDIHASENVPSLEESKQRYDINFDEYGILIFHSVTSETDTIEQQAKSLISAINESGKPFICIASNNDPGSDLIMQQIRDHQTNKLKIIPSIRFEMFSRILRNAKIVVGNSSLGVREAPFLGIPSINVGTRQNRRATAGSIKNFSADQHSEIRTAICEDWGAGFGTNTNFGSGNSSDKFKKVISDENFWNFEKQKIFHE